MNDQTSRIASREVPSGSGIAKLVVSAQVIDFADTSPFPSIVLSTLIIPGDKTTEGTLVKAVSKAWFEILRHIQANPNSIYGIHWRKWEEIIAGAYKQAGWDTVTLTPRRGR